MSNLLVEFVTILQTQDGVVEEMQDEGRSAAVAVKDSGQELQTTLERSEAHGRNVVFMSVGLAIFLLLLDFITP